MAGKIALAPWHPHRLEVYVACRSLHKPVPRAESRKLVREKLIRSKGDLTSIGWGLIGRLRHLRKTGMVEPRPVRPGVPIVQTKPSKKHWLA